ncbi:MAG TPA: c-type cytochrome [Gemmatimonadales bacterium]
MRFAIPAHWAAPGVLLLFLAAAMPLAAQEGEGLAQNVMAGSRVFGGKGCVQCHAINGIGGTAGPDLARAEAERSVFAFVAAMWNHLPGMVGQMRAAGVEPTRLAPWDAGNLVAFLSWAGYFSPAGDTAVGRRLFADKACIACHQAGGMGGVVGPALDGLGHRAPIQVATTLWNHGPAMATAMRQLGIRRPTFTDRELNDLVAYLSSRSSQPPVGGVYVLPRRPAAGRALFAAKGCANCHSIRGQGGTRAPDLGTRPPRNLLDFAARMWNKAPGMTQVMREAGIDVPQLGPGDMADLVAYLASVRYLTNEGSAGRGRERLGPLGCLGCHAVDDFTRTRGLNDRAAVIAVLWNHLAAAENVSSAAWPVLRSTDVADITAFLLTTGRH